MKPSWLHSFGQYLDRQAWTMQNDGYGQSRKVNDSGWYDAHEEIRCYAAIHYYFQLGLGGQERRKPAHHQIRGLGHNLQGELRTPQGALAPVRAEILRTNA
jgi:hypothetical protein